MRRVKGLDILATLQYIVDVCDVLASLCFATQILSTWLTKIRCSISWQKYYYLILIIKILMLGLRLILDMFVLYLYIPMGNQRIDSYGNWIINTIIWNNPTIVFINRKYCITLVWFLYNISMVETIQHNIRDFWFFIFSSFFDENLIWIVCDIIINLILNKSKVVIKKVMFIG